MRRKPYHGEYPEDYDYEHQRRGRSYHEPEGEGWGYQAPTVGNRRRPPTEDYSDYEYRRNNYEYEGEEYFAPTNRGQHYFAPKKRTSLKSNSYLPIRHQSAKIKSLLKAAGPTSKPATAPFLESQKPETASAINREELDISIQDKPAPKVTVDVEGIEDSAGTKSVSSLGLSEAVKLNLPTATAGPSKGNVSDEIRKLKLRTDNWTTKQFLELLKYTKDITLALCYTLAAPVNLEFPNSRYFGPTIAPEFRGPTADVVKLWRLTKNASCVLTGANVLNSLIELFSFFKQFGTVTSEDLLWIILNSIDQPRIGPKPLQGALDPSFLLREDEEILDVLRTAESLGIHRTLRFMKSSFSGYFNLNVRLSHQSVNKLMMCGLTDDPVREGRSVADSYNTASSSRYRKAWEQMLRYMSVEGENKELSEKEIRSLLGNWNLLPNKFRGMLECEGRAEEQADNHSYPSPADIRRLMGAPIPESDFLTHQDLFKQEIREIVNVSTTEMQQTRRIIQDLQNTVEEFKTQLNMMAAIKPLSAPLEPRADPSSEVCAVVKPGRKPRPPRGSYSECSTAQTFPGSTDGQTTSSLPDIYEMFRVPGTNTNVEIPVASAATIDPFKSDEED